MRRTFSATFVLSVLGALLVCGAPALAQSEVEAAYTRGTELRSQHQDAQALEVFQGIYQNTHQARALAQIGMAEGALGRWADAEAHLREAIGTASDPWIATRRSTLTDALNTISSHLGDLDVMCSTAGAELFIRGNRVAGLPLPRPLRIAAGTVTFEVRAAGFAPASRTATIVGGGFARETVELDRASTAATTAPATTGTSTTAAVAPATSGTTPATTPPEGGTRRRGGSTLRTVGFITAGVAVAALAVGAIGAVVAGGAISDYNANASCPGQNAPSQPAGPCTDSMNTGNSMSTLAIAGFVAGGVLAATSVALIIVGSGSRERAPTQAFACGGGPGELGVACRLAF